MLSHVRRHDGSIKAVTALVSTMAVLLPQVTFYAVPIGQQHIAIGTLLKIVWRRGLLLEGFVVIVLMVMLIVHYERIGRVTAIVAHALVEMSQIRRLQHCPVRVRGLQFDRDWRIVGLDQRGRPHHLDYLVINICRTRTRDGRNGLRGTWVYYRRSTQRESDFIGVE